MTKDLVLPQVTPVSVVEQSEQPAWQHLLPADAVGYQRGTSEIEEAPEPQAAALEGK
jgi:hypothetical protein